LRELKGSWLFMPRTLELREATYEWGKAGFMVFTIKLGHVPSPEVFMRRLTKPLLGRV
jgi:hypothetical protein